MSRSKFKKSSIGVYEMLKKCRCKRSKPGNLDLPTLFKAFYAIKKKRGSSKYIQILVPEDRIEWTRKALAKLKRKHERPTPIRPIRRHA